MTVIAPPAEAEIVDLYSGARGWTEGLAQLGLTDIGVARLLRTRGWSAWAGVLNSADYGVPQTRRRAILIASADRAVTAPPATHADGGADTLFGQLAPWVTMADALGWNSDTYEADEPAPTIAFGKDAANRRWELDRRQQNPDGSPVPPVPPDRPAPTLTGTAGAKRQWVWKRPATTIACDSRVWPPGHKINQGDRDRLGDDEAAERYGDRAGTDAIRLTVAEALALQSFRPDYPLQGTKSAQFLQVGNAIPPRLAAHVAAEALGVPLTLEAVA